MLKTMARPPFPREAWRLSAIRRRSDNRCNTATHSIFNNLKDFIKVFLLILIDFYLHSVWIFCTNYVFLLKVAFFPLNKKTILNIGCVKRTYVWRAKQRCHTFSSFFFWLFLESSFLALLLRCLVSSSAALPCSMFSSFSETTLKIRLSSLQLNGVTSFFLFPFFGLCRYRHHVLVEQPYQDLLWLLPRIYSWASSALLPVFPGRKRQPWPHSFFVGRRVPEHVREKRHFPSWAPWIWANGGKPSSWVGDQN